MFEEEAGEMCSVVPGNCFLCCDFWKSYCFKTTFLLLEEPSMSVIHLMNEKSGNMANCPIKFHNSERKYNSASVKRLFSTAMTSK